MRKGLVKLCGLFGVLALGLCIMIGALTLEAFWAVTGQPRKHSLWDDGDDSGV